MYIMHWHLLIFPIFFNGINQGTGGVSKIKIPTAIIQGKKDVLDELIEIINKF